MLYRWFVRNAQNYHRGVVSCGGCDFLCTGDILCELRYVSRTLIFWKRISGRFLPGLFFFYDEAPPTNQLFSPGTTNAPQGALTEDITVLLALECRREKCTFRTDPCTFSCFSFHSFFSFFVLFLDLCLFCAQHEGTNQAPIATSIYVPQAQQNSLQPTLHRAGSTYSCTFVSTRVRQRKQADKRKRLPRATMYRMYDHFSFLSVVAL